MITTTLERIRAYSPCAEGWQKLLKGLGKTQADDEPLQFSEILRINGLDDALWCCRAEPQHAKEWRLYAVQCARRVQHMTADPRSLAALDVAERYASGEATAEELAAARAAAGAAARADSWAAARAAARAAAWAAAGDAAGAAAWAAAGDAAGAAAWAASWAAARAAAGDAAGAAAWAAAGAAARAAAGDAAWDAAWDAARTAQATEFKRIISQED